MNTTKAEIAVFGGGCFWCTEAVFSMIQGVISVESGYAGGTTENPTYHTVADGKTDHAEVIKITFDPSVISYEQLLTVFFASHDGSQVNRQGADIGTQYRSIILYTTQRQKQLAEDKIQSINTSTLDGKPIVTEVVPLIKFTPAETYHQNYYENNEENMYCELVINPKLEKVQKEFSNLLKTHHEQ